MQNVLITGATGFLGYRVVEHLLSTTDYSIIAAARTIRPERIFNDERITYLYGDLTREVYLQSLFSHSINSIVNCASLSAPWGQKKEFLAKKRANCSSISGIVIIFWYLFVTL